MSTSQPHAKFPGGLPSQANLYPTQPFLDADSEIKVLFRISNDQDAIKKRHWEFIIRKMLIFFFFLFATYASSSVNKMLLPAEVINQDTWIICNKLSLHLNTL